MVEEQNQQNKLKRLKVLSVLLNRAGWACLVVWLVSVLAVPSLLSQANKAKQVEARNNTGAINRAQQAFYLEHGKFGAWDEIGIGIQSQTKNYDYSIVLSNGGNLVFSLGIPKTSNLNTYVGVVWIEVDAATKQNTTSALLCERIQPCSGTIKESALPKYKEDLRRNLMAVNSYNGCNYWGNKEMEL